MEELLSHFREFPPEPIPTSFVDDDQVDEFINLAANTGHRPCALATRIAGFVGERQEHSKFKGEERNVVPGARLFFCPVSGRSQPSISRIVAWLSGARTLRAPRRLQESPSAVASPPPCGARGIVRQEAAPVAWRLRTDSMEMSLNPATVKFSIMRRSLS